MTELMAKTSIDGDLSIAAEYEDTAITVTIWKGEYPLVALQLGPESLELICCCWERIRTRWEESVKK